ncbi:MAG: flagellar basal body FlgE domain-containing protein, partial [Nitrospirales bacterium]
MHQQRSGYLKCHVKKRIESRSLRTTFLLFFVALSLMGIGSLTQVSLSAANDSPKATTLPAKITTKVTLTGNLSAGDTAKTFDINDPIGTSTYSTGFLLFDSLGFGHGVTMYFNKTANNRWSYNIVGNASEFTVVSTATSVDGFSDLIATGTLGFTSRGLLDVEGTLT